MRSWAVVELSVRSLLKMTGRSRRVDGACEWVGGNQKILIGSRIPSRASKVGQRVISTNFERNVFEASWAESNASIPLVQ